MAVNKLKKERRLKRALKRSKKERLKQSWRQIFVNAGILS